MGPDLNFMEFGRVLTIHWLFHSGRCLLAWQPRSYLASSRSPLLQLHHPRLARYTADPDGVRAVRTGVPIVNVMVFFWFMAGASSGVNELQISDTSSPLSVGLVSRWRRFISTGALVGLFRHKPTPGLSRRISDMVLESLAARRDTMSAHTFWTPSMYSML